MATEQQFRLLALCALRVGKRSPDWSVLAREASEPGGLDRLYTADVLEESKDAERSREILAAGLLDLEPAHDRVAQELAIAERVGARLVTVLDDDYPANLQLVHDLPPFLFMLGDDLRPTDLRSIAVVGTRQASAGGLAKAARMAQLLSEAGVTVVSGLARGIDTAAHEATLASGGRTIAVIGTGISRTYPAENRDLADQIAEHGLMVSQFWPSTPPATWTFPRRNRTMSGIAQGTVVIEASATSGAKMQARLALAHGKYAFLLRSLVTDQDWARTYVANRGAVEVERVEDVLELLAEPDRVLGVARQRQLTFDLT